MSKIFLSDYHIHTNFSIDADRTASPEAVIQQAIDMGFNEIAITDHMDFHYKTIKPNPHIDIDEYARCVLRLKEIYSGRINVLLGLELGPHKENVHLVDDLTRKYPFDFIICSTHDIKGVGTWDNDMFFIGKKKRDAHEEYLNEVLCMIDNVENFSVYGHLDYLDRYAASLYKDPKLYYSEHADMADSVLKRLVAAGKGLEVNTSGYRYGLGGTNPKPDFLRRYRELGGEILTMGSDAHSIWDIGRDFLRAADMLASLGFKYLARFEGMEAKMVRI